MFSCPYCNGWKVMWQRTAVCPMETDEIIRALLAESYHPATSQ